MSWSPHESYWHGTYDVGSIKLIITEGLRAGSSVSSSHGQATAYPILLEFKDLDVEPVYYRPEDYKLLSKSGRPVAIYVVPEDYGRAIRPIDDINKDLGVLLEELEAQGISPEEVGDMLFDYPKLYKIDRRLGDLIKELNESADLEAKGVKGRLGGEQVLQQVVSMRLGIPVYRLERDEEGEIDWESRRQVG